MVCDRRKRSSRSMRRWSGARDKGERRRVRSTWTHTSAKCGILFTRYGFRVGRLDLASFGFWRKAMLDSQVDLRERVLGCLIGCAVGDALGAPYEGLWPHYIPDIGTLLSGYAEFEGFPPGQYTD